MDLLEIPGVRRDPANIDYRATLDQAQDLLNAPGIEALCIRRSVDRASAGDRPVPMITSLRGVITQEDIDNYREYAQ